MPAQIKILVRPTHLYRFRDLGANGRSKLEQEMLAIEAGYLWASNFLEMNDPMEGLYTIVEDLGEKKDWPSTVHFGKLEMGICSLSETIHNELMWAHYADNFRGLCVEYDVERLLTRLDDGITLVRMTHQEDMIKVGQGTAPIDQLPPQILSVKNHRWQYEREWRLLCALTGRLDYGDSACVSRVILGGKMQPAQKWEIAKRLGALGVRVGDLVVEGYKLEVKDFAVQP